MLGVVTSAAVCQALHHGLLYAGLLISLMAGSDLHPFFCCLLTCMSMIAVYRFRLLHTIAYLLVACLLLIAG